jgi:4,5-dihydroxyphthalate decarboxylase
VSVQTESTSTSLEVELPVMRYDVTMPLLEGRVTVEGVRWKPTRRLGPMVTSDSSPFRDGSFGLGDLNLGYFLPALEAGWELIGLPVFSKRKPVYGFLFARADRGIDTPKDLEGRRIGSRQYRTAISVWMRGLLREHFGVDTSTFEWVVAAPEVFPVYDDGAHITRSPIPDKSAVDLLLDGEVDAIISDISDGQLFARLAADPKIKRLVPNYAEEDLRLYGSTGIFTPVHLMVMSRQLDRAHPQLARQLLTAFEQAKQLAYDDILGDRSGFSVVYLRERLLEQMQTWGDPWKYGLAANRGTLETFARYNQEQGMTRGLVPIQTMFAASTLES